MLSYHPIIEFIKSHIYILLSMVCIVVIGALYIIMGRSGGQVVSGDYVIYSAVEHGHADDIPDTPIQEEPAIIIVHIVGEVNSPGIVQLPEGSRIIDALQLVGGETEYADLSQVNLAAFVQDAMQIRIPAIGEEVGTAIIPGQVPGATDGLININTATAEELQRLSGVGPVLAQNIIDFRETHGGFSSVDELINVPRIGAVTLERLRPLVTVQ